jgi:hypothetical protein
MNNQDTGHSEVTCRNFAEGGFGNRLLATLRLLCQPDSPQHIGMFAGSFLSYELWAPPKEPH